MASPEELAGSYRIGQVALSAATVRDTAALWPLLDLTAAAATYATWETAMATLIARNVAAAGTLGGAYVRAAWVAANQAGAPGIVRAVRPVEQVATSLRVTSLVAYRRSLGAGLNRNEAARSALVQVSGSASRLVADAARETVAQSTVANGGRWTRVVSPGACSFCRMVASRGAAFRTGTNFASHDHCSCSLVSQFGATTALVAYTPSTRNISDADRARVRAWLKANPDAA